MKGEAQRMAGNEEQRRALRSHNRKFRLTETDRRKLEKALATLTTLEQPVSLALEAVEAHTPAHPADRCVRVALRLLINGPAGEFR